MAPGLSALLALGCLSSCAQEQRPPNVLLIVVDTLRADRLGCYGAERDTSPRMDALAREGVRFERAFAPSSWTMPSVASVLTGLYPVAHGATAVDTALPSAVETLAERLKRAGYATAGATSNMLLAPKFGFDQGFDTYLHSEARGHEHVSTPGITRQAEELLEELAEGEAPFFLHLLYFDPHYQYQRHPEFGFSADGAGRLTGEEDILALREMAPSFSPEELRFVRDLYDEEVRFTDAGIGRVLTKLEELGLDEETIVVLVGDHGEDLMDHGWLGHVRHFHQELVHVPFILRAPGRPGGVQVPQVVGTVSVMPTLLELLELPADGPPFQGPSLGPLVRGEEQELPEELLFHVDFTPLREINAAKETHKSGMLAGNLKLTRDDVSGELQLFDLSRDPLERDDLAQRERPLAELLEARLKIALDAARAGASAVELVNHSAQELDALDALGYGGD